MTVDYTYNDLGFVERIYSSDGTVDYRYQHDKQGKLLFSNDAEGKAPFSRTWDEQGNMTGETLGKEIALRYAYDGVGRLTHMTLPDQSSVDYAYDGLRLRRLERRGALGNDRIEYGYCLSGKVKEIQLPAELGMVYFDYDRALRPVTITSPFRSQTIPDGGYDERGNLTEAAYQDHVGGYSCRFRYDFLNQLIEEAGQFHHRYRYDSAHNRTEKDAASYTHNALHELVLRDQERYEYDSNGNLLTSSDHPATICRYDAFDRLISSESGAERTDCVYDALHRRRKRIRKERGGEEWITVSEDVYLFTGDEEIGVFDEEGKLSQLRIRSKGLGKSIDRVCLIEVSGKRYVSLHDDRGSAVTMVDVAESRQSATLPMEKRWSTTRKKNS